MRASPVTVVGPEIGNLDELKETGFCVYDLQRMHDARAAGDLGVLEVDFYRADAIAEMTDDETAEFALLAASKALGVDPGVLSADLIVDRAMCARATPSAISRSARPPSRLASHLARASRVRRLDRSNRPRVVVDREGGRHRKAGRAGGRPRSWREGCRCEGDPGGG